MPGEVVTSEPRSLRVALIGCGRISAYHLAALKAIRNVEVVAVCDLDERGDRETTPRHGIRGCYTDMESMLGDLQPEVVHLLPPPASHLALARIAAKHRAHMYIEKPFAANETDARLILELAREAGV